LSNEVYANGMEIACKAGDGKVIAAFPDVCLSPPSPPAGPIPVPYPDTSFSKDMQNGSKTVSISGQEVMLKDQSFYNSSPLGNEAATNGLGAGVITHVITGKTYFIAWSMDVKFEGENVDRHLDLTTSNHASPAGNSMVQADLDKMSITPMSPECKAAAGKAQEANNKGKKNLRDPDQPYVVCGAQFVPGSGAAGAGSMGASMIGSVDAKTGQDFEDFAPGTTMKEGSYVECGGKKHKYASCRQLGHAESKVIETLFKQARPGTPQGKLHIQVAGKEICCECQKLINCANQNKGFEVVICPPSKKKEDCD
jgi:uncharacterized protein DUF4150